MEAIVHTNSDTTIIQVESDRITMNGFAYPRTRPWLRTLLHSALCHPLQRLHEDTTISFKSGDEMQTFTVGSVYLHVEDGDGRLKSLNMLPRRSRTPDLLQEQRLYRLQRRQQKSDLNAYMLDFISKLR